MAGIEMLIGHAVGDYLLQTNWMAINKNKNTFEGWMSALLHCILYTLSVCTIMQLWNLKWVVIVFMTHFIPDKFSLAEKYLYYIKFYGIRRFMENKDNSEYCQKTALLAGFTSFVYVVTDNTIHLLFMLIGYKLLFS